MARAARKFSRLLLATLLLLAGVAMLVLPGPGLVAIALGLGVAGKELQWEWVLRCEAKLRGWMDNARSLGDVSV